MQPREERLIGELLSGCLGDAEVDNFGGSNAVVDSHENVGWLKITVDDAFLMCVLDGLANEDEQLQALRCGKPMAIAVFSDSHPTHEFHHKIRTVILSAARVENPGDMRVFHECQCLSFRFETGNDFRR